MSGFSLFSFKGCLPEIKMYITTPALHMSTAFPYSCLRRISGAMNMRVPHRCDSYENPYVQTYFVEIPKSISLRLERSFCSLRIIFSNCLVIPYLA